MVSDSNRDNFLWTPTGCTKNMNKII